MIHYCSLSRLILAASPFIVSLWGPRVPLIPLLGSLGTKASIVPALLMTDSFLLSHSFLLLVLFP